MPSASTDVEQRGAAGRGAERVGEAAVHEQRRVDAVREVAELLHGFLEIEPDLVEHRLRLLGIGVGDLAREAHTDRERDEVLLRAVVQVAFDAAPLGVGRLHDAGAGRAQLVGLAAHCVERLLERGVELHVVEREPDLAGELGEREVVGVVERERALRAAHDDRGRAARRSS